MAALQEPGLLEGKVAIVTGAGGGIGRAVALAMAEAGAKVLINDIGTSLTGEGTSSSPAEETLAMIRAKGGDGAISTESVASWDSARRIVEAALDNFGRLDAVVNNAGIVRDVIFHKMSEDDWRSVIDVHLHGSFFVSRAAAEHFRAQSSGAFIHMSSTSALVGNFGQANYSAAKLGIVALSKSIALDMKRFNVRSNVIAPSAWSRMTNSIPATTPGEIERVRRLQMQTPEKNAPLSVFLSSDAASEVNGQIFFVRSNEIFLFSSTRPVRSVHRADGWTPETIAEHGMPALSGSFMPVDRSGELFSWDPI